MDFKKIFEDMRAIHSARQGSRIQVVLNAQVIEQLSGMQGGTVVPLVDAATEIWPSKGTTIQPR
ncbi:MAG: hypothetical protein KGZ83_02445 [Sulfuricella sp.]|nr:hypothetical protein [Sulfuricella sp.]